MPEQPLREVVAAASASIGQEAGDAFPMPSPDDRALELLRGLAIVADRDVQRAYIQGLVTAAGLDLIPAAAWLLLRLEAEPGADPRELGRRHGIPADRIEAGLTELRARKLIESTPAPARHTLTAAGCDAYDRLAAVRRQRLVQLQQDWPPEQRRHVAVILQRFASELVPPRAA